LRPRRYERGAGHRESGAHPPGAGRGGGGPLGDVVAGRPPMTATPGASAGFPRYRPLGDQVVVVQLGDDLSLACNGKVRALARLVEERGVPGVRQLIPAQTSLAVRFDPMKADFAQVVDALRALEGDLAEAEPAQGKTVTIPVVY